MNDSNIILDFDGNLQGYSGNKEILDLDIEATATPSNISMQFQDNNNNATYYTQIPIPVEQLNDEAVLEHVISLNNDSPNSENDLIRILETDYPITSGKSLDELQMIVQDKINTIHEKLPYLSEVESFPLVKNTITEKSNNKKSKKKQKKNKKKSRKVR